MNWYSDYSARKRDGSAPSARSSSGRNDGTEETPLKSETASGGVRPLSSRAVAPLILSRQRPPQRADDSDVGDQAARGEALADEEPGLGLVAGQKGADGDLHGGGGGALGLVVDVVGRPGEHEGGGGIDSQSGEDGVDVGQIRQAGCPWMRGCRRRNT